MKLFTNAGHRKAVLDLAKLVEAVDALEAEELDSRNPGHALELSEAERSFAIAAVRRVSLPGDADLETPGFAQASVPVGLESRVVPR